MRARRGFAALLLAAVAPLAQAGRDCAQEPPTARAVEQAMGLAERTARALDATGARVVVLARAGQDLSAYGLRYSHLGLAYRTEHQGRAVWRVLHKLNACGTAHAALHRQGLGQFFLDDLHEYQAGVAVLRPELQMRLAPLLADDRRVAQLHTPRYSMVAYPWAQTYQQSNQWAIETLAFAMDDQARTLERAQAWLRLHGYVPTTLRISPLKRLGARASAAHIAFDDHPNAKRYANRIETVTVDSVFAWLTAQGLAGPVQSVR